MGEKRRETAGLFGQMLTLPAALMASGAELFALTARALAGGDADDLVSRVTHTLNSDLKDQARRGAGRRLMEGGARLREGETEMKEKDSKEETLKLVRYKVLFVKRGYEVAFQEREELVADDLSATDFTAWKVAEFIQRLDEEEIPKQWRNKNYPREYAGEGRQFIGRLPEGDKKYLRLYWEVLDTYKREKFRHEHKQIAVLEEIRDELRRRADKKPHPTPKPGIITLPKTMVLAGRLDPVESEFGDQFFHFPDFLGAAPPPGGTKLTGWLRFEFQKPSGHEAKFTLAYFAVGTPDMIQWGKGAQYRLLRNRAFPNPTPFNAQGKLDPTVKSGGTLDLRTGEVRDMAMHAIFQNTVIAAVDRLNRIPFGFPNDYPPPTLPPGVELPFPDRPPIYSKARFKTDGQGNITGFEFHGESIAPVTLFPYLGLFPPFSFGPNKEFHFANPTDCVEGTPPANCPRDESHPDGVLLPPPAFFHPHFDLVTSAVREIPKGIPQQPCLPGGAVTGGFAAAAGGRFYLLGGADASGPNNLVRVLDPRTGQGSIGPPLPEAVSHAQGGVIGSSIYLAGGLTKDGKPTGALQVLDTGTNTWSVMAPLPTPVAGAAAAAIDGKLYVVGGDTYVQEAESITDRVQVYDPATNTWSEGAPAPQATAGSGGVAVGSKLYVIGGRKRDNSLTRRVSIYNAVTDRWHDGARLLRGVYEAAAAADDSCIYLIGGRESVNGETERGVQLYVFANNAWRDGMDAPLPTAASAVAAAGGLVVVVGGSVLTRNDEGPATPTDAVQVFSPFQGWLACNSYPLFTSADVMNTASLSVGRRALSPGCRASISGYNLADAPASAPPDGNVPTKLGGISITVDGRPAPIFSVAPGPFPGLPGRVDFLIPYGIKVPKGDTIHVPIKVTKDGAGEHPPVNVPLRETTPGIFVHNFGEMREPLFLGDATALACNEDGTLNYPDQPALRGEVVTLYMTGLGRVTPEPAGGERTGDNPTNKVTHNPTVTVGGKPAEVVSTTLAPNNAGLYLVRFRVPAGTPYANNVRVEVTSNEVKSNHAVISVRNKSTRVEPPVPCALGVMVIIERRLPT